MSNLDNYTRRPNNDWALWVKLVKDAYKQKGHILTQQQALMVAKQTYPGKGNVVMDKQTVCNIPVNDNIPANPVRQKKKPAPKKEVEVYERERSPPRNKRSRKIEYSDDEDSYDSPPRRQRRYRDETPSPPRRRRNETSRRRREETPSPPRRRRQKKEYIDSEDEYERSRHRRKY